MTFFFFLGGWGFWRSVPLKQIPEFAQSWSPSPTSSAVFVPAGFAGVPPSPKSVHSGWNQCDRLPSGKTRLRGRTPRAPMLLLAAIRIGLRSVALAGDRVPNPEPHDDG